MNNSELEQKLETYIKKFEDEVKVTSLSHGLDLHNEALKTADLLVQWTNIYIVEKKALKKMYQQRDKLILKLKQYYSGKGSPEEYEKAPLNDKVLRTELDVWIRANDNWISLQTDIDCQESVVELAERACEVLKTRGFLIRDALRYLEFINGM